MPILDMVISTDYDGVVKGVSMKTMGISQFKAHALKILDQVAKTREEIVITKRGKPLAQIIPCRDKDKNPTPGRLADAFIFEKDIITPLGEEMWESSR
jgi:prevent-host-death family protein